MGLVGITLYTAYWSAVVLSLFWRPIVGLCFIVPMLPLQNVRYGLQQFPLGAQCIDVVLAAVALGLLFRHKQLFPRTPFTRLLGIYTLFTYLWLWKGAFFLGGDLPFFFNNGRLADWKNYIVVILLYFLVLGAVETKKDIRILLLVMCAAIALVEKSYYSGVSGRDMSSFSYDIRFGGVMGFVAANGTAAFLSQALGAFMVLWASCRQKIVKYGSLALMLLAVYCVMFAFSRGAYLALLLLWLVVGFLRKRILLVYFGLFLVSWQVLVPAAVQQRVFMTVKDDGQLEESAADRQAMWTDAMQLIQDNPLTGTGFHTYAFMGRVGNYRDTHNYYIKVMVETGLIGLAIFLTMLFKMLRYGFRLSRTLQDSLHANLGLGFSLWIMAQMVVSLFGDRWTYIEITGFTFVYLALMVRAEQIEDSQPEPETEQVAGEEPLLGALPAAAAAQ